MVSGVLVAALAGATSTASAASRSGKLVRDGNRFKVDWPCEERD